MSEAAVRLEFPPDALEAIAVRAAEIALARLEADAAPTPWLSAADAIADYLGWRRERVYKRLAEIPHVRHGNRIMARRSELDAWLERHRQRGVGWR